jgi:hypothetical protein
MFTTPFRALVSSNKKKGKGGLFSPQLSQRLRFGFFALNAIKPRVTIAIAATIKPTAAPLNSGTAAVTIVIDWL